MSYNVLSFLGGDGEFSKISYCMNLFRFDYSLGDFLGDPISILLLDFGLTVTIYIST
jgi:hypothetical protein